MKILMTLILVITGTLILSGCSTVAGNTVDQEVVQNTDNPTNVRQATLQVEDMTCTSCALGVEYQLKQVDGVLDAKINYEEGKGYVKYDADKVSAETIAQASDVYPAKVIEDTIIQ